MKTEAPKVEIYIALEGASMENFKSPNAIKPMIPKIIIPVLNRGDLLLRCVRSIDTDYKELIIINNGDDPTVAEALYAIKTAGIYSTVLTPDFNLGCAASWNLGLKFNGLADFAFIIGNDIQLAPGELNKMASAFDARPGAELVLSAQHGYSLFGISKRALTVVGFFDENFYPAYFEDNDYHRRVRLSCVPHMCVPTLKTVHGDGKLKGSCTVNSDARLRERNCTAFEVNRSYYARKWGGTPDHETTELPFGDKPMNFWEIGPERQSNFALINS